MKTDNEFLFQALAETKLLQTTKLSSAVLSVFIDSANDLPQVDDECKPDPFVVLSVGNVERKSSAKRETDNPVWEQGFTFLVANPEQDILQIRVAGKNPDEKYGDRLGQFTFKICELLTQNNLQMVMQSYQLKKSGATSKITMALALKILKKAEAKTNELPILDDTAVESGEELLEESIVPEVENLLKNGKVEQNDEEDDEEDDQTNIQTESADSPQNGQSSLSFYGLGNIKITMHYSVELQYLSVTIHKIM